MVSNMARFPSLVKTKEYFIVGPYYIFFTHSSVDSYFGCFHILANVKTFQNLLELKSFSSTIVF